MRPNPPKNDMYELKEDIYSRKGGFIGEQIKSRTTSALKGLLCFLLVAPAGARFSTAASPAETFANSVIESLGHSLKSVDAMVGPAEAAAARLLAGGSLYVTDDETIFRTGREKTTLYEGGGHQYPMHEDWGGFVAEACDRAGGFRLVQPVPVDGKLKRNDVVLVGTLELNPEAQLKQLQLLKRGGALIILFGSEKSRVARVADHVISNGLPTGVAPVMEVGKGRKIGPIAGIVNVANMWAFTAEFVAAATRRGKMPTMYQSMLVPGAAKRNEVAGRGWFYSGLRVSPVEPGKLGRRFLQESRSYLQKIVQNQLPHFQRSGALCAGTLKSGHKVVASVIGHFMTTQTRMPGYPDIFQVIANQYGTKSLQGQLRKGDLWLHVGYSFYPLDQINYARASGARLIGMLGPGPTVDGEGTPVPIDASLFDIYIDPYWRYGDGIVEIPGFEVAVIPVSGVVMISGFWMILGETMSQMAG